MFAYNGKVLEVDLTSKRKLERNIPEDWYKNYLGGSGLAAKIFFEDFDFKSDPLSENNILMFSTGPLTGTNLPGCATRFSVCGRSPLTGIWAEASCGGSFGIQLKQAGFDGITIKGASKEPVYILIEDGKVEIKDAKDLWGKDTYTVYKLLKEKDKVATSISIGIAGENLVKFACIANDPGNYAGRCGLGAVMGAKKLKAIAVKGTKKIDVANKEKLDDLRKELLEKIKENIAIESLKAFGTDSAMELGMMMGDVPIKNWSIGVWDEGSEKLNGPAMADTILTKNHACYACPVACKRVVKVDDEKYKVEEGPGPEYETCSSFGTLIFNNNLEALAKINESCNKYGMDTISCGCTIAFAIDCFNAGLISESDTDGLKLNWGNVDDIIKLLDKIAKREGFGALVADGSRRLAEKIGKNAEDFLVEVKGLEAPMHDPRAFHGMGLAYATSNRGACHVNSSQMYVEHGYVFYPELDMEGPYTEQASEGKADLNVKTQNLGSIFNSACICLFAGIPFTGSDICNMLNYTTGFNYTLSDMMRLGERIWLLKRGINNLLGVKKDDDKLPKKILTAVEDGGAAGSIPNIELMLKEFYELRELDSDGRPKKEKLESVGLQDLAKRLHRI